MYDVDQHQQYKKLGEIVLEVAVAVEPFGFEIAIGAAVASVAGALTIYGGTFGLIFCAIHNYAVDFEISVADAGQPGIVSIGNFKVGSRR